MGGRRKEGREGGKRKEEGREGGERKKGGKEEKGRREGGRERVKEGEKERCYKLVYKCVFLLEDYES